jgi:hypothetical protein
MILSKAYQNMTTQFCRTLRRKSEVFQFIFSTVQWVKMNYYPSAHGSNYECINWEDPNLEIREYGRRDPSR